MPRTVFEKSDDFIFPTEFAATKINLVFFLSQLFFLEGGLQTSERLSSLYLIQRQIGASHNAYF